jgi:hypothetical protein
MHWEFFPLKGKNNEKGKNTENSPRAILVILALHIAVIGLLRMGRGHAHSKMTSGCVVSHLRVYDVIRRDKMACNHDIRESENSREQTEVSDFSLSVFSSADFSQLRYSYIYW